MKLSLRGGETKKEKQHGASGWVGFEYSPISLWINRVTMINKRQRLRTKSSMKWGDKVFPYKIPEWKQGAPNPCIT